MTNPFTDFNPHHVSEKITGFLNRQFTAANCDKAIIALSGGIDSCVTLYLTVRALTRENVLVLLLPYGDLYPQGLTDSRFIVNNLKIPQDNVFETDIKPICQSFYSTLDVSDKLRQGNIMARVRMTVLYDTAKKNQALVVGTENKSEYLLGYYTRFGDEASDIEPIRGLYKTQVRKLAEFLQVPQNIISNLPSANLWPEHTDEGEMGFSYEHADKILYHIYDQGQSWDSLGKLDIEQKTVNKIKKWVEKNEYKHHLPKVLSSF